MGSRRRMSSSFSWNNMKFDNVPDEPEFIDVGPVKLIPVLEVGKIPVSDVEKYIIHQIGENIYLQNFEMDSQTRLFVVDLLREYFLTRSGLSVKKKWYDILKEQGELKANISLYSVNKFFLNKGFKLEESRVKEMRIFINQVGSLVLEDMSRRLGLERGIKGRKNIKDRKSIKAKVRTKKKGKSKKIDSL